MTKPIGHYTAFHEMELIYDQTRLMVLWIKQCGDYRDGLPMHLCCGIAHLWEVCP